jgi:hypothetical protein
MIPRAFLPFVSRQPPPEPELTIYDYDGMTEQDWAWLEEEFGAVVLDRGNGAASVRVLRAITGPSTLTIWVEDAEGNPLADVPVVFSWPGADPLESQYYGCGLTQGVVGETKVTGEVGFGMGTGAYYFPPDGGPHTVWVAVEGTDCLRGMGMLGGTEHNHVDSVWVLP